MKISIEALWDLHGNTTDTSNYLLRFKHGGHKMDDEILLSVNQFIHLSSLTNIVQSNPEVTNIEIDEQKLESKKQILKDRITRLV